MWHHIDQYKGFIGCYKIDLTLSLSTKTYIDAVKIYNSRNISGFNRASVLISRCIKLILSNNEHMGVSRTTVEKPKQRYDWSFYIYQTPAPLNILFHLHIYLQTIDITQLYINKERQ